MAKKICELCLSPDLGGLELYMVRVSQYLNQVSDCISIVNESGKLKNYYENTPNKYITLKHHNVFLTWLGAKKLAMIIDTERIDVLHLHWTKDLPLAIMAKLLSTRKPCVVQSRHMTMTRFKDDFYHRFVYRNLDRIFAVTQQVKSQIEKFVPSNICPQTEVLYIGAEQPLRITEEEKKIRGEQLGLNESFIVGIIGRIEPQKGQWVVIDAIEKMIHQGIDAKALIIGHAMSDEYLAALLQDVVMRGLKDRIVFTGFTREVQVMMQLCDVVVLATQNETFGLVLIEAMMSGICVIASDSGGPLEIIDDSISGLLFKTFDSDDLTTKLILLQQDSKLREKLALAGQKKAMEKFESQKQFAKLQDILEQI